MIKNGAITEETPQQLNRMCGQPGCCKRAADNAAVVNDKPTADRIEDSAAVRASQAVTDAARKR